MTDSRTKNANKHIGEQLRRYRGKTSQVDFGRRFGLSHTTIGQHERGVRAIESGRLFVFAQELGVSVESFFPKQSYALDDDKQEKLRAK